MNHSGWSGNPKYHFTISLPTEVTFILQREEQHATPRKENERPFIGFYIFRAKGPFSLLHTSEHQRCALVTSLRRVLSLNV